MARLQLLKLSITTGAQGTQSPVRIRINGHTIPVSRKSGGTGPHEVYEGEATIGSVVHSLELMGPTSGVWDIARLHAFFTMDRDEPYGNEVAAVRLEADQAVNIWAMADTFSV